MPPAKANAKQVKEKVDPKKQLSDLIAKNEQLLAELENSRKESASTTKKLSTVLLRMIESMDDRWKKKHVAAGAMFDPSQLHDDVIAALLDQIIVKHQEHSTSVESRAEQLEKKVTHLSAEFLRVSKKNSAYELGLRDVLSCCDVNAMADKIHHLLIIAGEAYHSGEANDLSQCPIEVFAIDGITERADCDAFRDIDSANKLQLVPPPYKESGETPVKHMNNDLRLYIVKELSIEKSSGADWRVLAQRVGLAQSTIDELASQSLMNTAGHVLDYWTESCPSASVRLFHRHLISPTMRCTVLGKRISDFYEVL